MVRENVPLADQVYDNYLAEIEEENNAKDDKFSELRTKMPPKDRAEARRLADQDRKGCLRSIQKWNQPARRRRRPIAATASNPNPISPAVAGSGAPDPCVSKNDPELSG